MFLFELEVYLGKDDLKIAKIYTQVFHMIVKMWRVTRHVLNELSSMKCHHTNDVVLLYVEVELLDNELTKGKVTWI